MTFKIATPAIAAAILLSGCNMDAASCDPNTVGNVLTSAMCNDQFAQRQQNLGGNLDIILADVERERMEISRANTTLRDLRAQQRLNADQSRQIDREIAALQNDVTRLSQTGSNPSQAAALRQSIAQRKAAVNSYAGIAVF